MEKVSSSSIIIIIMNGFSIIANVIMTNNKQGLTVLCGSSTVRLVSSGHFTNTVTVFVKVHHHQKYN